MYVFRLLIYIEQNRNSANKIIPDFVATICT